MCGPYDPSDDALFGEGYTAPPSLVHVGREPTRSWLRSVWSWVQRRWRLSR